MQTQRRCTAKIVGRTLLQKFKRMCDVFQRRRHKRWEKTGDTVTRQLCGDLPNGCRVGGEIHAEPAVELEVNEPGREREFGNVKSARICRRSDFGARADRADYAVFNQYRAIANFLQRRDYAGGEMYCLGS